MLAASDQIRELDPVLFHPCLTLASQAGKRRLWRSSAQASSAEEIGTRRMPSLLRIGHRRVLAETCVLNMKEDIPWQPCSLPAAVR